MFIQVLRRKLRTPAARRFALLFALLLGVVALISSLDLPPNLARVRLAILSGSEAGNYHAFVARLAMSARNNGGNIDNIATHGSGENLERLLEARRACNVQFAVAQDRRNWPSGLELVARIPRPETIFFLGKDADRVQSLADLRGMRIGIGPEDSGTADAASQFLADRDVIGLGLQAAHYPLDEQLAKIARGDLDLGVFVIDESSTLIETAIREHGLSIVSFPQAFAITQRYPRVRVGRIIAGQYDAIKMLPPTDKIVFQIDPVVVGNGCAWHSQVTGLLMLLTREFPNLVDHNRQTRYLTNLPLDPASQQFIEKGQADFGTQYAPWLTDIFPFSNWLYAVTAISVLINLMNVWCRFGLSRIDGRRVNAEQRLGALFHPGITASEIARLRPAPEHHAQWHRTELADLIVTLDTLRERCRKESMSWSSDWGEEMKYRYQEHLMMELSDALRGFQARVNELSPEGL